MFTSETGRVFANSQEALRFIRECQETALNPSASWVESSQATVELLYAVKGLDDYLMRGGQLPFDWRDAMYPHGLSR